jgi:hypothetical protein
MRNYLTEPVKKGAKAVQCYVMRDKSGLGMNPIFRVFLEEDNRFLMSAKVCDAFHSDGDGHDVFIYSLSVHQR